MTISRQLCARLCRAWGPGVRASCRGRLRADSVWAWHDGAEQIALVDAPRAADPDARDAPTAAPARHRTRGNSQKPCGFLQSQQFSVIGQTDVLHLDAPLTRAGGAAVAQRHKLSRHCAKTACVAGIAAWPMRALVSAPAPPSGTKVPTESNAVVLEYYPPLQHTRSTGRAVGQNRPHGSAGSGPIQGPSRRGAANRAAWRMHCRIFPAMARDLC